MFFREIREYRIDLLLKNQGNKIYVQVAYKLENNQTVEREFEIFIH